MRDKISIYGLNLMMGIFAYPIYPEMSRETLMMIFPAPESGIRTFHSSFTIKSDKIKNAIKDFKNNLMSDQSKKEFKVQ